jgi:hypothetical protein
MYSATGEFRSEAENEGLSPGKYLIYEQLKEAGDQVNVEDVRKNNIRKLVDTYKLNLLPNYKNISIQRKNGEEPDVTVDDNGRAVSIADFFKNHKGDGVASRQEANAVTSRGAQPKKNIQSTQPKITTPVKNQNNKQTGGNEIQQKNVRGTSEVNTRKRGLRAGSHLW